MPCYGALFGPQLFGHGTRVESHKSFGAKGSTSRPVQNGPSIPREQLETKLREFNETSDNKGQEIRSREVNGRLVLEGALRVYWGVQGVIHLKDDDYPLLTRIILGPHEDVSRIFLMDTHTTSEIRYDNIPPITSQFFIFAIYSFLSVAR